MESNGTSLHWTTHCIPSWYSMYCMAAEGIVPDQPACGFPLLISLENRVDEN
jgi:hypothetical protein